MRHATTSATRRLGARFTVLLGKIGCEARPSLAVLSFGIGVWAAVKVILVANLKMATGEKVAVRSWRSHKKPEAE